MPKAYQAVWFASNRRETFAMLTRRLVLLSGGVALAAMSVPFLRAGKAGASQGNFEVTHTEAEWRKLLTPEQFAVLRQAATERPFTSPLLDEHRKGNFACAGCELSLFSSET